MRARSIAGRTLSVIAAVMFVPAAVLKLIGNSIETTTFVQFGLPIWFMYVVAVVELTGVALLLFSKRRLAGAALLTVVGLGAIVETALHMPLAMVLVPLIAAACAVGGAFLLRASDGISRERVVAS